MGKKLFLTLMIQVANMSKTHEIVYTNKKTFSCEGGKAGHPKVFFTMNRYGYSICNYCNVKYVYKKEDE
jgi:uncharacterized Zn-finger protein